MSLRSGFKIVAVLALLGIIVGSFILFGSLRSGGQASDHNLFPAYISILGILLFSFLLFLMLLINKSDDDLIEKPVVSNVVLQNEEQTEESAVTRKMTLTIEELKKRAHEAIPSKHDLSQENYSVSWFAENTLSRLAKIFPIVEGIFFLKEKEGDEFIPVADYAYFSQTKPSSFKLGETLPGQVAKNRTLLKISDIPPDYIKVASGLGQGMPEHLFFLPLLHNEESIAVIEISSFKDFGKESEHLLEFIASELSKALVELQKRNL